MKAILIELKFKDKNGKIICHGGIETENREKEVMEYRTSRGLVLIDRTVKESEFLPI